ncbi:hypothetical protein HD806DRAFT_488905 [Xylariaceae sp. AK1471]|nr:hypothetical protein HD806DRAFT_488905 [Xylariaceae sp. AK1471]
MQEKQRLEGQAAARGKRLCDYFDMIAGTSTGGLLAIMLGRLQMDTRSCIAAYLSLSKRVFAQNYSLKVIEKIRIFTDSISGSSWFDEETLKEAICETIHENMTTGDRESLAKGRFIISDLRLEPIQNLETHTFVRAVPAYKLRVERISFYLPLNPSKGTPADSESGKRLARHQPC